MKEISDVYVHHPGDECRRRVTAAEPVTRTQRRAPISEGLCYGTDVTVKARRTVTWSPNSTTAQGAAWRSAGGVILRKTPRHGHVFFWPNNTTRSDVGGGFGNCT